MGAEPIQDVRTKGFGNDGGVFFIKDLKEFHDRDTWQSCCSRRLSLGFWLVLWFRHFEEELALV